MDIEWIRQHCMSLAHTTEQIQWHSDLVFKVGGKIYAVAATEPAPVFVSFKCADESFSELVERPGIIPAPYLARAKWVALEDEGALSRAEVRRLLSESYKLVLGKLPKSVRESLGRAAPKVTKKKIGRSAKR
jgi:predicted DNA-binding protein (MmcQ/YjbR family)